MNFRDWILAHRDEILGRWRRAAEERLGLESARVPHLLDDMPEFIEELATCLEQDASEWCRSEGAAAHGRHRVRMGFDIGAVAEEFGLVAEVVLALAEERRRPVSAAEAAILVRVVARGSAESARAYATARDDELASTVARHFAFVAHEIRTPLQTASIAAQLLSLSPGDAQALASLERAHTQLATLVDASLRDARLYGEIRVERRSSDASAILREVADSVTLLASRRRVTVAVDCAPFSVEVDPIAFRSMLTNLLANAVKFTREGSEVKLIGRLAEDRALFEVLDECGGLPAGAPARLFQPFVQASQDRSGVGLGLMIVRRVAEAHGGAVRVLDRPPDGCTFVVELPHRSDAS